MKIVRLFSFSTLITVALIAYAQVKHGEHEPLDVVPPTHWAYGAISKLGQVGLRFGFGLDDQGRRRCPITRMEIASQLISIQDLSHGLNDLHGIADTNSKTYREAVAPWSRLGREFEPEMKWLRRISPPNAVKQSAPQPAPITIHDGLANVARPSTSTVDKAITAPWYAGLLLAPPGGCVLGINFENYLSSAKISQRNELPRASVFTSTDAEVIEALLVDLLDDKSFCLSYKEPKQEEAQIVVNLKSDPNAAFGFNGFLGLRGKDTKVEGFVDQKETKRIPADICADLKSRNKMKGIVMSFRPKDNRIMASYADKRKSIKPSNGLFVSFEDVYPKAKASVSVALPGYSTDGSECVIRFTVGPTPHGSEGTALLRRDKDKWRVISRNIQYYL